MRRRVVGKGAGHAARRTGTTRAGVVRSRVQQNGAGSKQRVTNYRASRHGTLAARKVSRRVHQSPVAQAFCGCMIEHKYREDDEREHTKAPEAFRDGGVPVATGCKHLPPDAQQRRRPIGRAPHRGGTAAPADWRLCGRTHMSRTRWRCDSRDARGDWTAHGHNHWAEGGGCSWGVWTSGGLGCWRCFGGASCSRSLDVGFGGHGGLGG